MTRREKLEEALQSAIDGCNSGDIVAAAADLEEFRFADLVEAAECVVATAFGNIDGLSEAEQLEHKKLFTNQP